MAIQDRNLAIGTQLYARYKGATHTAEVVEKEGNARDRLADGREFKSPSAAGTAITGLACNGWAFWSVGDGSEAKPAKSAKAEPPRPSRRRPSRRASGAARRPAASE